MPEAYLQDIAKAALALVGCGYIYGATGWICTAARVEQQAKQYPDFASLIRKYGLGIWLGKRCYDCAQLTRAAAKAGGVTLPSGATSQWKADVWEAKGTIDTLPDDPTGCFLYRQDESVMQHTGVCTGGGEFVDSRGHAYGVLHTALGGYKWTHWARPKEPNGTTGSEPKKEGSTVDYSALAGKTVTPANLKAGTTKLNLRAEATTGSKQISRVALGEKMQCVSLAGEWALCIYGENRGYCMAQFLQAVEASSSGNAGADNALYAALEARVAALEKLVVGEAGTVG